MVRIISRELSDKEAILSINQSSTSEVRKIERYFFYKYRDLFYKIAQSQKSKFYSLAIDLEDLEWLASISINECIISYKKYLLKNNNSINVYPFYVFLTNNYRYKTLDYLKKHVAKKHRPLNQSKLINCTNWYKPAININNKEQFKLTQLLIYQICYEKYFSKIQNLTSNEKHIWKMKLTGYKLGEITTSLQLKYSKIDNTIQKISRIMKRIQK